MEEINDYENSTTIERDIGNAVKSLEEAIEQVKSCYEFLATYRKRELLYGYTDDLTSFLELWRTGEWEKMG
jgi:hypothetical protein